jgi:hypothetical protein
MNIHELDSYRLSNAIKFNDKLNPRIWGEDEHLLPDVRDHLLAIADDFREFLGLTDIELKDVTISGSNAAYTYTPHSDIDLHLVVDLPRADASEVYRELFDAKKYQYNDQHNFKIGGYDVELYVQNANQPPVSQGEYSVLNNDWLQVPKRQQAVVDDMSTRSKYQDLGRRIESAIADGDRQRMESLAKKIREMRTTGLANTGEFGPENLAFKLLRASGLIDRLREARLAAKDHELSLQERKKKKVRYGYGGYWMPGFSFGDSEGGDGGGESVQENTESPDINQDIRQVLQPFIDSCVEYLGIEQAPKIILKRDPEWTRRNGTFGQFDPETRSVTLAVSGRHVLDILRTLAHELTHARQDELATMPVDAGETGSPYEDEANAMAGRIMRHWVDQYPEFFKDMPLEESLKNKLATAAAAACIAGTSGCATTQGMSTADTLKGIQTVGRTAQTVKQMGSAGAKEELIQQLKNELRRQRGQLPEARTNPDQNIRPESGMKELQAVAKTISDPQNWAISMTAEPKLGINPQVGISEDTPKGIYFYPLDYAVDMARSGKKLPWGDNMPYIQLFQYDRSGEMTKDTQVDPAKLKQALSQYCSEEIMQQAAEENEYDGTPYWFIYDCLSRLGKGDETNIIRWNKVLRDLGFTSVFDSGGGWIAYNEPTQGVVLDPRIIKQHKTINNKQRSRVVTPAVIEQAIFDTLDIELAADRSWQAYDPDGSKLRQAAKEYAKDPKFKPWFGKPGTEEIFDKAASWGRYGARQLSQEAWEWYKAQQAQQPVTESLDQPYKILRWEKGDYGDVDAIARLDDGTFLSIMFNKGFSQDTKEEAWSVEFYRNNSQEKTGEGDQQRVFATVLSAVQTFISDRVPGAKGKYKPNKVYFSASKEVKPDEDQRKAMTRARLYDSLVQRYARALGFRAFRADTGNKVMYELSRIKPIAEASGYIPVNDQEARDPRYSMALTVDIKPGEVQRQARKMGWRTTAAGTPPTLKTSGRM